jgi:hypothetical protein
MGRTGGVSGDSKLADLVVGNYTPGTQFAGGCRPARRRPR